ncbi:MAG: hypothetical protein DGJ47_000224 [Rickettsiaceae bacterium]
MHSEYIKIAKKSLEDQTEAMKILTKTIPDDFSHLIEHILQMKGRVISIGMGKSGYVAKKLAASLASTGTPSFYIHPAEASHGDLGMITKEDLVIMMSNSGETKELFDTINYCRQFNIKVVAITANKNSTLAQNGDFKLILPKMTETTSVAAPTTSALVTLAIGDAIVTTLLKVRNFTNEQFKIFHPGGKIATNLLKVQDLMHKNDEVPLVRKNTSFDEVIMEISSKRLGCAIVVDENNSLEGVITDGDIRRHINDDLKNISAKDVMTKSANHLLQNDFASKALVVMNKHQITTMPVLESDKVIGVLHVHDIIKKGIEEK